MAAILTAVLAIFTALGFLAAVWGFRASRRPVGEATWWFLMGFCVLAGSIVLRGLYWDVFWTLMKDQAPESAYAWSDATGGTSVNVLFASMNAVAIFCALKCRQLLIPEDERSQWPWWKAWMHPTKIKLLRWP